MKICVDLKCSNCGYEGMRLVDPKREVFPCRRCDGKLEIIALEEKK